MRRLVLLLLFFLPCPALACSLCGSVGARISLVQEFDSAQAALYGHIANAKLDGPAGKGTTEFHVEKVVKDHPDLPRQKMLLLSRWLPILDAKDPPRYLMFFAGNKQKFEPYTGRQLSSPAVLDFLAEYQRHRAAPMQTLLFAAGYLDHPDSQIAEEAFLLFARADDRRIGTLARQLSPDRLRKLVQKPGLEPERLSMFAFLLGACGTPADADLLRSLLKTPGERNYKSFEGILAGYISMRPQEGWAFALETLKNEKNSLLLRYATLRTLRFFYNAKAAECAPQVMQGMALALDHFDIADMAIQDLRKWKRWEYTRQIVACYDRKSHQAPIIKNGIVRYTLACPLPEARTLLERVRREDPELVRDLEEEMMLDLKK
jgi:hypothetical protein